MLRDAAKQQSCDLPAPAPAHYENIAPLALHRLDDLLRRIAPPRPSADPARASTMCPLPGLAQYMVAQQLLRFPDAALRVRQLPNLPAGEIPPDGHDQQLSLESTLRESNPPRCP